MINLLINDGFDEIETMSVINLLKKNGVDIKTVGVNTKTPTGQSGIQIVCDFEFSEIRGAKMPPSSAVSKNEKTNTTNEISEPSLYSLPPAELFKTAGGGESTEKTKECEELADILLNTLARFNINACITGMESGPRLIRYEVIPAKGVRISAITSLYDDLSLAIEREGMRIEPPVPGKSGVGIEIPTRYPRTVPLGKLIRRNEFIMAKSKTTACIGEDISGAPVFCDIAKAPNMLIAGAVGMGKSVFISSLLASVLCKATPDDVRLILIDTKRIEFSAYSGLPHLLTPVISEPDEAYEALTAASAEMSRRYEVLDSAGVKSIDAYNDSAKKKGGTTMPKILIVIDELSDLMFYDRQSAEFVISELCTKAKAVGIHLIMGTQRPTLDVLTPVLKSNIGTRISFKVSSGNDSRAVLDRIGAEKLLPNGDMLYSPNGAPKPLRVQGAYISEAELIGMLDFIREKARGTVYDPEYIEAERAKAEAERAKAEAEEAALREELERAERERAATASGAKKSAPSKKAAEQIPEPIPEEDDDGDKNEYFYDDRFIAAVDFAIENGKISSALIQRKFSIGTRKADKFIEAMEEFGIVSASLGPSTRDALITKDGWKEFLYRIGIGR